jgi:hypothetical protein
MSWPCPGHRPAARTAPDPRGRIEPDRALPERALTLRSAGSATNVPPTDRAPAPFSRRTRKASTAVRRETSNSSARPQNSAPGVRPVGALLDTPLCLGSHLLEQRLRAVQNNAPHLHPARRFPSSTQVRLLVAYQRSVKGGRYMCPSLAPSARPMGAQAADEGASSPHGRPYECSRRSGGGREARKPHIASTSVPGRGEPGTSSDESSADRRPRTCARKLSGGREGALFACRRDSASEKWPRPLRVSRTRWLQSWGGQARSRSR